MEWNRAMNEARGREVGDAANGMASLAGRSLPGGGSKLAYRQGRRLPEVKWPARVPGLKAMAVEFPEVAGHPNRLPFEGCLTLVDRASDRAPSGARGHRVLLTRAAAEAAIPTLLGMAVDYKAGWDGHDARQKCGIITSALLDEQKLMVAGYLYARDFPELEPALGPGTGMGMSYELADAHVADMRASIWTLTKATFTGAAILLREKAAYRSTSFRVYGGARRAATALAAGGCQKHKPKKFQEN